MSTLAQHPPMVQRSSTPHEVAPPCPCIPHPHRIAPHRTAPCSTTRVQRAADRPSCCKGHSRLHSPPLFRCRSALRPHKRTRPQAETHTHRLATGGCGHTSHTRHQCSPRSRSSSLRRRCSCLARSTPVPENEGRERGRALHVPCTSSCKGAQAHARTTPPPRPPDGWLCTGG
jgi:hypothetical protein